MSSTLGLTVLEESRGCNLINRLVIGLRASVGRKKSHLRCGAGVRRAVYYNKSNKSNRSNKRRTRVIVCEMYSGLRYDYIWHDMAEAKTKSTQRIDTYEQHSSI